LECHHRKPLASLRPGQRTRLSDLALVCPNCHRMLHRMSDPSDVDGLRDRIQSPFPP
jgi:5-methylcytosine-specific restriction protein A